MLKGLVPSLYFAAVLIGILLVVTARPGPQSDALPITSMPPGAVASLVHDARALTPPPTAVAVDSATVTPFPPTGSPATLIPAPTDSATATPELPTGTATTASTATRRPPAATPSRTLEPLARLETAPAAPLPAGQLTADEGYLLAMVNAERTRAGLPQLSLDPVLQSVAHARALDMIARKFYSHIDPATGQHAARAMLFNLGVRYSTSENFYSGRPYDADFVGRAMRWLMGDAEHRENLLLRYWTRVGVGVAGTPGGIAVVTQVFGAK